MSLLASLRAPLRIVPKRSFVAARTYVPLMAQADPWASPQATESEADVRADLATPANEKPSAILQEETINEIHERTDEEEYHEALARELKVKGKEFPTASEADVRADRSK